MEQKEKGTDLSEFSLKQEDQTMWHYCERCGNPCVVECGCKNNLKKDERHQNLMEVLKERFGQTNS